mmetsp:Transcript_9394/g.8171  ORF Transcript_9394/g.8171 Transcript_9394/m.8171 type:complete len:108 (+) Transcript_9394:799-1122(+)
MRYQLQGAQKDDEVFVKVVYPTDKSIRLENVYGGQFPPKIVRSDQEIEFDSTDECGSHYIILNTGEHVFKLTGNYYCQLYLKETNVIRASVRYQMTMDEFFGGDGVT